MIGTRIILACFLVFFNAPIFSQSITVIYPNGGEILFHQDEVFIKWHTEGVDGNVVILLFKDGIQHSMIARNTENSGKYIWRIPEKVGESKRFRIRIRSIKNLSVNDFSDSDFEIKKRE